MKNLLKRLVDTTPYRVRRASDLNRFQAIHETLRSLKRRGYQPAIIIDGGANIGDFTRVAYRYYPDAIFHLIEPQPACAEALTSLCSNSQFIFHPVALGASGNTTVRLVVDPTGVTTGAHIEGSGGGTASSVEVPLVKLDDIMEKASIDGARGLLKLDLQGFELEALKGAERSLQSLEVILCEVSFFAQAFEPSIEEIITFLTEREFQLHDIASLSARRRDNRAHQADFLFVRRTSHLLADAAWS